MELTNINYDLTPKLKSSPIPINFISFKEIDVNCYHCGKKYTETHLYDQKYCKNCFIQFINEVTDNNTYLSVCIGGEYCVGLCQESRTNKNTMYCKDCSFILYFEQIITEDIIYKFSHNYYNEKKNMKKNCNLCGKLASEDVNFSVCSECYKISSGWINSICDKPIPVCYLPWWDNSNRCLSCRIELKFVSDCQKWCSNCYIIYTGCRYCLTTNIIFGLSDQSQCKKCKRILVISIDYKSIMCGIHDIDEFLLNTRFKDNKKNKIINQIINEKRNHDSLDTYKTIIKFYLDDNRGSKMSWVPYSNIVNLEKLAERGFSTIHKAILSNAFKEIVVLKQLKNSQKLSKEILSVLRVHFTCHSDNILRCHGLTKDPNTDEYILIMEYATGGNLHDYLLKNFAGLTWKKKLNLLYQISKGLLKIHDKDFIHRDLHSGNILLLKDRTIPNCKIGDFWLSQPANNATSLNDEIYGVIPYIAPEVFNGSNFSKASDIYSFGMIIWEFTTGCKPFANVEHNTELIYKIIDGERPEITKDTPECFVKLLKRCWESDPMKRPSIAEVHGSFWYWYFKKVDADQFKQAESKRLELLQQKILGTESIKKYHSNAIEQATNISEPSSINSTSSVLLKEYTSRETEFDINELQSSSSENVNSTIIQHPGAIYTSRPLSALISAISEKRIKADATE
ncbi:hypothetical protein RclHR1_01110022 [Rhizophagus clarus]|uniref:Kinase-like domain-containing protein n=1 Tax=Rhizophagus clarus TaxID=94130 RepID=A0A2Z6Q3Q1_9GLOM|nr:hypothetical protein RclHR1_01110022 [Rhizophagus clarus]GES74562.1 kinase-like domain-containing protein [Rhizophagus clarus]